MFTGSVRQTPGGVGDGQAMDQAGGILSSSMKRGTRRKHEQYVTRMHICLVIDMPGGTDCSHTVDLRGAIMG